MTTWTPVTENEATWSESVINVLANVRYNDPFEYDADFLVYDGDYITGETDWLGVSGVTTTWREEVET